MRLFVAGALLSAMVSAGSIAPADRRAFAAGPSHEPREMSCGPASLLAAAERVHPACISRLTGELRTRDLDRAAYTTFKDLRAAARGAGLDAVGLEVATEWLCPSLLPAVVQYGPHHFVAALEVQGDGVRVLDEGRERVIPWKEFGARFTGRVLSIRALPSAQR